MLIKCSVFSFTFLDILTECFTRLFLAREGDQSTSSGGRHYFVLDRWSFHSLARIPTSRLGTTANIRGSTHRQLVLVTNHSFSISLSDMQVCRKLINLIKHLPKPEWNFTTLTPIGNLFNIILLTLSVCLVFLFENPGRLSTENLFFFFLMVKPFYLFLFRKIFLNLFFDGKKKLFCRISVENVLIIFFFFWVDL